jgi:hypothetical protein
MTQKQSDTHPLDQRRKLTFKQADGIDPLPSQLTRQEISKEFRAALWARVYATPDHHRYSYVEDEYLLDPWDAIPRTAHAYHDHEPIDEFPNNYFRLVDRLKRLPDAPR